ncbi:MAG: adenylate kinase family enzyme [Planctomycetota bacterium]|jgi:adenylate kinase family enzyme
MYIMEQPYTFLLVGRSGSGKGTQAKLLIDYLGRNTRFSSITITTGDHVRGFLATEGHTRDIAKNVADAGELQPLFLPIWMWSSQIIREYTGQEHLILDGAGRRMAEVLVLESMLDFYGSRCVVIHLDLPREEALERMISRDRSDDKRDQISQRLDWFDRDVNSVLDYTKAARLFDYVWIDGTPDIEGIHNSIIAGIGSYMK